MKNFFTLFKIAFLTFIFIFTIAVISADDQMVIACFGDSELIGLCPIGDEQNVPIGPLPVLGGSPSAGGGGAINLTEEQKEEKYVLSRILDPLFLLLIALFIILIIVFFVRRKKKYRVKETYYFRTLKKAKEKREEVGGKIEVYKRGEWKEYTKS